jgi:NADPH2:quinone reductase
MLGDLASEAEPPRSELFPKVLLSLSCSFKFKDFPMQQIIVERFGGPEVLRVIDAPTPAPAAGQVRVKLTSIGMNYAELMARTGQYKLMSGDPPFTPGLEGGGVIEAVGAGVTDRRVGQRVILGADATRRKPGAESSGAYRSHFVCDAALTILAPDVIPDDQLGGIWLPYLTAWGCLVWRQQIKAGQFVALPAASSSVALAAAQICRRHGAIPIGLTSSAKKVEHIKALKTAMYEHIIVTGRGPGSAGPDALWIKQVREATGGRGVDVFFDPVAAGDFLAAEVRLLASGGTVWIYGLLGEPGVVDLSPLIRKSAGVRGWVLYELIGTGETGLQRGYNEVLEGFTLGHYKQHVARTFKLADVRAAQTEMEKGEHIGKLVLVP